MSAAVSRQGEHGPRPDVDHSLDELFGAMSVGVDTRVACTADRAWAVVSDISRIGEFSPECAEAWWVDSDAADQVGARFEGKNRVDGPQGVHEWIRLCEITVWEPPRLISWTVGNRFDGTPATEWSFAVEPAEGPGVVIRQRFRHRADGLSGLREAAQKTPENAAELIAKRSARLREGMSQTLARMRSLLESAPPAAS